MRSFYKNKPCSICCPLVGGVDSSKKTLFLLSYFSGCGGRTKKLILEECELEEKGVTTQNEFG